MNAAALDNTFSALADPTRRAILARLARGATTVGELAKPFDISLPAVALLPARSGRPARGPGLARIPSPLLERKPGSA
jgi:hypothetical protein